MCLFNGRLRPYNVAYLCAQGVCVKEGLILSEDGLESAGADAEDGGAFDVFCGEVLGEAKYAVRHKPH